MKKLTLFLCLSILLSVTVFFVWKSQYSAHPVAAESYVDETTAPITTSQMIALSAEEVIPELVLQKSELTKDDRLRSGTSLGNSPEELSPRYSSSANSQYSPALNQIVGEEQLRADISAWEQHMEEQGLVRYFKGEPSYPLFDGESSQSKLKGEYSTKTAEELVALAQQNDPYAMLALANRAWSAGLWEEGDVYAMYAARISGSSEPLLHGASQRLSQSPLGYEDRDSASWFLAAYLQGNLASATLVEGYFRFLSEEDQYWAVGRARQIIDQIHNGG